MDHEKPEAVFPQIFEYNNSNGSGNGNNDHQQRHQRGDESGMHYSIHPDVEFDGLTPIEEPQEERREPRGDSLWRVLDERQINMIAFSGSTGNGLFLGSGRTIALAGPGGATLCYILMGTVVSSVISCLGEMTSLMPVNGPVMEFPRRFMDRGVGFAVGWMYWFAYATIAAQELVAVTNSVRFSYDDGTTSLRWAVGVDVDPAVWVSLFLVLVVVINMLPVRYFGELEYIFGCIKIAFITMLIVMMLILNVMKPRANSYYDEPISTRYWDRPYSFFNHVYHVKNENGEIQRTITGAMGTFLGMWMGIINSIFSFVGMDIVAATAAESKSLADAESMKMAARKISIRIITFYVMAVFTASFVVPYDHPFINGGGTSVGSHSPFIIAPIEAGIPSAAHFINAMFVLSSFTCGIDALYVASRVLHTLALRNQTGPEFITRRLRQCRSGVPMRAVCASGLMMLLAFMGRTGSPGERLAELTNNVTVSYLIIYAIICATYLYFFRALQEASMCSTSEAQAATYERNNPRYPYKSHSQWLKAAYGFSACVILVLFNGVNAFVENPFGVREFIASYIGILVLLLLILGYKLRKYGLKISQWFPERSGSLHGALQVANGKKRKGRLEFPDEWITKRNVLVLLDWIWVWMK